MNAWAFGAIVAGALAACCVAVVIGHYSSMPCASYGKIELTPDMEWHGHIPACTNIIVRP